MYKRPRPAGSPASRVAPRRSLGHARGGGAFSAYFCPFPTWQARAKSAVRMRSTGLLKHARGLYRLTAPLRACLRRRGQAAAVPCRPLWRPRPCGAPRLCSTALCDGVQILPQGLQVSAPLHWQCSGCFNWRNPTSRWAFLFPKSVVWLLAYCTGGMEQAHAPERLAASLV